MKTATSQIRPAVVLGVMACLTFAAGTVPLTSSAQDSTRTIATGSNIPLAASAPDEYVVKRGDTLWDISKLYLRDPWYWPEIWYLNPQVANPHLIYPGDVLKLIYIDGQPRLTVAERGDGSKRLSPQVRREPLSRAVTSIPYEIIAGFAGRPVLLDKDQVEKAPYIVALRDEHMIGGEGNEIYARGIGDAAVDTRYSIVHVDGKLRDPDNNDLLGYTGIYVGSGPVARAGDPAKLVLTETVREALQGDKLFPEATDVKDDFVPHAPSSDVKATVIAVKEATVMGQYQLVALNRGSSAGLEPGHILAVSERGEVVRDKFNKGGLGAGNSRVMGGGKKVQLPDERIGLVMVFNTTPRMSYALVLESQKEIREGDSAANP
ncbi:MAG TPA: LysM domain-containing protein [Povalibacter sp.]|uniref:LysM peptidoglycan-binding domain-containing protein n=1 Tax=Povalibacter sp. TaxID=1962978 RepID=UPI002C52A16D|nr:LysM domain-containing protein [Povalibacter sp.]HMN45215.1 LysM domain-containing protein [Povalibacter sp.]